MRPLAWNRSLRSGIVGGGQRLRDRDHAPPLAPVGQRRSPAGLQSLPPHPPTHCGGSCLPQERRRPRGCLRLSCGRAAWAAWRRRGHVEHRRARAAAPPLPSPAPTHHSLGPHAPVGWASLPPPRRPGLLSCPTPLTGDLIPLGRGPCGHPTPHAPTHGWAAGRLGEVFPSTSWELPLPSHGRGGEG